MTTTPRPHDQDHHHRRHHHHHHQDQDHDRDQDHHHHRRRHRHHHHHHHQDHHHNNKHTTSQQNPARHNTSKSAATNKPTAMDENISLATESGGQATLKRKNKPTRPGTYTPSPLQQVQTAMVGTLDPGRGLQHFQRGRSGHESASTKALPGKVHTSIHGSCGFLPSDQLRVPSRFIPPETPSAREAHGATIAFGAGALAG